VRAGKRGVVKTPETVEAFQELLPLITLCKPEAASAGFFALVLPSPDVTS
jgi:hypothetical protein